MWFCEVRRTIGDAFIASLSDLPDMLRLVRSEDLAEAGGDEREVVEVEWLQV